MRANVTVIPGRGVFTRSRAQPIDLTKTRTSVYIRAGGATIRSE